MNRRKLSPEEAFPLVYGNEEETGLLINHGGGLSEPVELCKSIKRYTPSKVQGFNEFLVNGFRIYPGNSVTNLERATPECSTIDELVIYMRASEQLVVDIVENYLSERSEMIEHPISARIQRRVVDSAGSRKGCHDNFGIYVPYDNDKYVKSDAANLVLGHFATRSFVTGAGHVTDEGLYFSQKVGDLLYTNGYDNSGSMYRISADEGTPRFESRCNDINISEWAARMRIGTTALALAISRTPLGDTFETLATYEGYVEDAKSRNKLIVTSEGLLQSYEALDRAVQYQKLIGEVVLDGLDKYICEIPLEHRHTAEELIIYCNDFNDVLRGDAPISILADRSDWAAKVVNMLDRAQADDKKGIERRLGDLYSQKQDLFYDYIGLKLKGGTLDPPIYGRGYKLRNLGFLRGTVSEDDAQQAYVCAPQSTRAKLRSELLSSGNSVIICDWGRVEYRDENHIKHRVLMPDVLQSEMPEHVNVSEAPAKV